MPHLLRFSIAAVLLFLPFAGCASDSYLVRPEQETPTVDDVAADTELVELASGNPALDSASPTLRLISQLRLAFQEQEELPPPHASENDDRAEEIPLPQPAVTEADQIVVPIPPAPPGFIKRLMRFVTRSRCDDCAEPESAVVLSMESPLFSPSGNAAAPDRWWTTFGNQDLDRQIEASLGGNFALDSALQRLRAAQALARREASDFWPDLNGFAEGDGAFRTFAPGEGSFALGLSASYQVDLWGQITSRVQAEQMRAAATAEDYQVVALTLSAEIARTWFTLIEAHAQLDLLDQQLSNNLKGLKTQETRFGGGDERVGSADVLRQRQLVESTREQIIIARSRIDVLEHRLALLQGRPPQEASYNAGSDLPALPSLPATGLPSELVQRRPDVRRNYLAILAADRDLAVAIRDRYPQLNLAAALTTLASSPAVLFEDWILAIAGQLIGPIIDGGQRRAEIDRTDAVLRQLVADYGQTVLIAFSEVEDALALERYQRQRIESLEKQSKLAEQAAKELQDRYFFGEEIGRTDYLDVLTATTSEQQLQRDLLSARLELILTRIALYLALAGGFEPHPQIAVDVPPPDPVIHERSAAANTTLLDSHSDFAGRLRLHSGRGGGGDRGDQPHRADRTADRGDPQVGGDR